MIIKPAGFVPLAIVIVFVGDKIFDCNEIVVSFLALLTSLGSQCSKDIVSSWSAQLMTEAPLREFERTQIPQGCLWWSKAI